MTVSYSLAEAKQLLGKLKRELEVMQNKYYFTDVHTADLEINPLFEGVFDHLYKAEKAIMKLEAEL